MAGAIRHSPSNSKHHASGRCGGDNLAARRSGLSDGSDDVLVSSMRWRCNSNSCPSLRQRFRTADAGWRVLHLGLSVATVCKRCSSRSVLGRVLATAGITDGYEICEYPLECPVDYSLQCQGRVVRNAWDRSIPISFHSSFDAAVLGLHPRSKWKKMQATLQ